MTRERKSEIRDIVLTAIALTGVIAIAVVAPNVIQLLEPLTRKRYENETKLKATITRSTKSLMKQGMVRRTTDDKIELTPKGQNLLRKIELRALRYKKPDKWDEKWRVVIFDIEEKKRGKRDHLRNMLRQVGFFRLQQSVWVFPYHIEPLVALLKTEQDLGKSVIYMVVESIENDSFLKDRYDL